MTSISTTPAGIAAQVALMRGFLSLSEYEPLIDLVIAGLGRLAVSA